MGETVIQVENLWKQYRLGTINHYTLTRDFQSWWAKVRGKEDPNSLVGSTTKQASGERFWALQDVSFEVKKGDILGIIGRNGAGKSTLLKILSQVTSPTMGEVRLKGRIASLLEVGTGFHPELSGRENIFLNGAILGMNKLEVRRKFDEIVDFAEVEKFIDTPVKRYSSGMYVRLAFAVAAHLEPEILIVDEVLAVGDAQFQKKCLGKMEDVSRKDGRTVLFVSHNMGVVNNLCTLSFLIDHGRIVEYGLSKDVISSYLEIIKGEENIPEKNFSNSDKPLFVNKIRLINAKGFLTNAFSCDEDIIIQITITLKKTIPGLYGFLAIINSNNQKVLISDTNDSKDGDIASLNVGTYSIEIIIPSRTLGHGDYFVTIDFASPLSDYNIGNTISIEHHAKVLMFSLDDISTARGNKRDGFFSTILDWKARQIV